MDRSCIFAAALALLTFWTPAARAQSPFVEGSVLVLDQPLAFAPAPVLTGIAWSGEVQRPGARFIRLHFSGVKDAGNTNYTVVIRDRNGRELQNIPRSKFAAREAFWTTVLEGDFARVEVRADAVPAGLEFSIKELIFQRPKIAMFSLVANALEPSFAFKIDAPPLYAASTGVAKLAFVAGGVPSSCTGFMIDDERMLTNAHCIDSQAVCDTVVALFGYEVREGGQVNAPEKFDCLDLVDADPSLDFALIRLDGKPGMAWGQLPLTRRTPGLDEQAFVIQHPGGQPKLVSRISCNITTLIADGASTDTDVGHKCDSAEGSSGSPILGVDFKVIGLHHLGFSTIEQRWMSENRGVRMQRIMDRLNLP